jgi:hypothetical protein
VILEHGKGLVLDLAPLEIREPDEYAARRPIEGRTTVTTEQFGWPGPEPVDNSLGGKGSREIGWVKSRQVPGIEAEEKPWQAQFRGEVAGIGILNGSMQDDGGSDGREIRTGFDQ